MEIEYRHVIFSRIYEIPCFFGITETDIAEFLLSYYQNKGVFGFGAEFTLAKKLISTERLGRKHTSE